MACGPHAAINARDRMKPEPRSCPGIEHQCVIGLSLPSYFQHRKPVKWRPVSAARDCPQGRLPLVRAASRLVSTPFVRTPNLSARDPCVEMSS